MSQIYSNPKRESETYSLPDVETFRGRPTECRKCGASSMLHEGESVKDAECPECPNGSMRVTDTKLQWFYWACFPGCLPDSDPMGPYATEAEAVAAAQEDAGEYEDEDAE